MRYIFLIFGCLFCSPVSVHAMSLIDVLDIGTGSIPLFPDIPNVVTGATAIEKVGLIFFLFFDFILYVIGIAAVVMIVYAGFRLVTSFGDEEQITWAKKTVSSAILGLIAVILSLFVVQNIIKIFYT